MLRLWLITAISIQVTVPLPQPLSDWSLFDSSGLSTYDPSSYLSADASAGSDMFSSSSDLVLGDQGSDWNSFSLPPDSGVAPEASILGNDIPWEDPGYGSNLDMYNSNLDIAATGCSGALGKREGGESCAVEKEDTKTGEPCDPDKEPQCCKPSWMFRSRWPGGGHNMDGCSERTFFILGG